MSDQDIPDFSLSLSLDDKLSPEQLEAIKYLAPVLRQCFHMLVKDIGLSLENPDTTAPLVGILASAVAKVAVAISLEPK